MDVVRRTVEWLRSVLVVGMIGRFLAAVVVGLGVGTALTPAPVTLPAVGTVPSIAVGGALVVLGTAAFTRVPTTSDCGCSGECTCS